MLNTTGLASSLGFDPSSGLLLIIGSFRAGYRPKILLQGCSCLFYEYAPCFGDQCQGDCL